MNEGSTISSWWYVPGSILVMASSLEKWILEPIRREGGQLHETLDLYESIFESLKKMFQLKLKLVLELNAWFNHEPLFIYRAFLLFSSFAFFPSPTVRLSKFILDSLTTVSFPYLFIECHTYFNYASDVHVGYNNNEKTMYMALWVVDNSMKWWKSSLDYAPGRGREEGVARTCWEIIRNRHSQTSMYTSICT